MFGKMGMLLKLAGQMKEKLPELQKKLAESEYTAEAEGGAVAATVTGRLRVVAVKIQPDLLGGEEGIDVGTLEDQVKAAVSAAQDKAVAAAEEAMRELTGGVDLPGMGGLMQ